MTDKSTLRSLARQARREAHGTVDPAPALAALHSTLLATEGAISFYWPIRTEIDPRPVMEMLADARRVCLPVTHGRDAGLTFRAWCPGIPLETDSFGVSVPAIDEPVIPQVLVVPMLAFDDRGHRLGYGAGHYDRTLDGLRKKGPVTAIGLAYEAQRVPSVPNEPTDQPLDMIITEDRVRHPLV